jgi:hypothetical protein
MIMMANDNDIKIGWRAWAVAVIVFGAFTAVFLWLVLSLMASFINFSFTSITATHAGRLLIVILWAFLVGGTLLNTINSYSNNIKGDH